MVRNIEILILRLAMGVALILNLQLACLAGLGVLLAPWAGVSGVCLALISAFALWGYFGAWMYVLIPFSKISGAGNNLYPTIRTSLAIGILFCIFWYCEIHLAYPKEAIVFYGFLLFCATLDIMQNDGQVEGSSKLN